LPPACENIKTLEELDQPENISRKNSGKLDKAMKKVKKFKSKKLKLLKKVIKKFSSFTDGKPENPDLSEKLVENSEEKLTEADEKMIERIDDNCEEARILAEVDKFREMKLSDDYPEEPEPKETIEKDELNDNIFREDNNRIVFIKPEIKVEPEPLFPLNENQRNWVEQLGQIFILCPRDYITELVYRNPQMNLDQFIEFLCTQAGN